MDTEVENLAGMVQRELVIISGRIESLTNTTDESFRNVDRRFGRIESVMNEGFASLKELILQGR